MIAKNLFPRFYFQRGKASDRGFIASRLKFIPIDQHHTVSKRYEQIYLHHANAKRYREARKEANEYIHGIATQYREKNNGKA